MQCKMGDDALDDGPSGDFGDESHGGGDGGIATRAAERGPHVEVARLKAENKEKQALIERLRNDLITADKQKESYSKEFATVEAQMAFYKQEVDRLTTEEEKFENKAKNFKSQRNDLDDRLDELERQNKKLLRFKESADDDLNQATEEAKKWKERYNDIAEKHEEYKLKQREEEMMKESTDNILKLQLDKAHAEVAELREELEHIKQEDNKIHSENDELKMVAEQSKAMKVELEELHKQKDLFLHMEKGELIEENMHLKRQIAVGKDELNKLQAEIIVLKSSDTQALRTSFLAVSPSNDAEDHFIKQDSHFDIQTEKALLGEMKTELNRLRKLSDIGAIQPQLNDDPSSPMPAVDDAEDDELPEFDNNLQDGLDLSEMPGSTIEPVWDMSGTFTGNPEEPLEADFFASPRRNRSKATSGREQIQTQG